jgi:uncharacterized protein (TIGR02466 family)
MKKFELFPTPVIEFDFTDHPGIPPLLDCVNNLKVPPHSLLKNGVSSYENNNILFDPTQISLRNDFQKAVDYYSQELKIRSSFIYSSWFNILKKNGKVNVHHHGGNVVSGAFYPLLEEGTCNLIFRSPLHTTMNFIPTEPTSFNHFQKDTSIPIKQYHLYIFPSWLEHYTEENKGDKRIVISFNTKFY